MMDEELRASLRVPMHCPACKRIMRGSKSNNTYYDHDCCFNCFIEFVEGREERWSGGWRPDEERMEKYYEKLDRSG